MDKRVGKLPSDPEEWYRDGLTECVAQIAAKHPRLEVLIDQRYTNKHRRRALLEAIASRVSIPVLTITEASSHEEKALQVADAVAWSIFQMHTWETDEFYRVIQGKIRNEIIIRK